MPRTDVHRTGATRADEDWGAMLRESGLRITSGRVAALGYLADHPHSSAGDVHSGLAESLPTLTLQSVHNITQDLTRHGLLRRVSLPDSDSTLYETRIDDNHHHVQCVVCRRVEDIDCVVGQAPCMSPDHTHGMRLIEAAVTFRGVCRDCDGGSDQTDSDSINEGRNQE